MGLVEVIKPPNDKKLYRRIDLENGLACLLIHDHEVALAQKARIEEADEAAKTEALSHGAKDQAEEDEDDEEDGEDDEDGDEGEEDEEEEVDDKKKPAGMKKAAAALAVGIGSFCDPPDMQGLSHYLEHMLFMGSAKFPKENEYDAYLTAHAGQSNAFTEWEATNYYLDVDPNYFHGALDRLAQCLSSPICSQSALEREVNAVNNEFIGCLQHDAVRQEQLMAHTARENHVAKGFAWGNKKSLWEQPIAAGINIRERLLNYYKEQYSAERMNLVLLGGEPLDVMEGWVRELFKDLPTGKGPRPSFDSLPPPFEGRKMYVMGAVKDQHQITMTFQFPNLDAQYRKKAEHYISHLVGHEGSGSLLTLLKAKGWATELSAGITEEGFSMNSVGYLFQICITLTQAGLHEAPGLGLAPVAAAVQYLSMLQATEPQEWVWQELKAVAEMKFKFSEEQDPCDLVRDLATNMHLFAPQHALVADHLYEEWDPQLVKRLLDCMRVDAVDWRIDLQTKAFDDLKPQLEAWQGSSFVHEPWFDIQAAALPLSDTQVAEWRSAPIPADLHLPPKNDYIPSDFSLRADGAESKAVASTTPPDTTAAPRPPATPPQLLSDGPGLRVWHKLDRTFATPRTSAYFVLYSPNLKDSAAAAAAGPLLLKLLEEALTEDSYLADVAGLHFTTSPEGVSGLEIKVDGFSHKLPVLTQKIFATLTNLQVSESSWSVVHEALVRKYKNMNMNPWSHATYLRLLALVSPSYPSEDVLAELEKLTFQQIQAFVKKLLASCHLECLLIGNLTAEEAKELAESVHKLLGPGAALKADDRQQQRLVKLEAGHIYVHEHLAKNPENQNAAMELYLQAESCENAKQRALVDMMEQMVYEPMFNILRTQEQLGYRVHCGARLTAGILGLAVWIVSGVYPADYLDKRAEAFLQHFQTILDGMSQQDFNDHVSSVVANKLQVDRNLSEEADRHWQPIMSRRYDFAANQEEVQELKKLTLKDVQDWWRQYAAPASSSRRKLTIRVNPQREQMPATSSAEPMETDDKGDAKPAARIPDAIVADSTKAVVVPDAAVFKNGMSLYPAAVVTQAQVAERVAAATALVVGNEGLDLGKEGKGNKKVSGVKRGRDASATS